jgi:hypothetical protein
MNGKETCREAMSLVFRMRRWRRTQVGTGGKEYQRKDEYVFEMT